MENCQGFALCAVLFKVLGKNTSVKSLLLHRQMWNCLKVILKLSFGSLIRLSDIFLCLISRPNHNRAFTNSCNMTSKDHVFVEPKMVLMASLECRLHLGWLFTELATDTSVIWDHHLKTCKWSLIRWLIGKQHKHRLSIKTFIERWNSIPRPCPSWLWLKDISRRNVVLAVECCCHSRMCLACSNPSLQFSQTFPPRYPNHKKTFCHLF